MQQMQLSASGSGSANSMPPAAAAAAAPANGGNVEQYQQIKLEDIFRVDASNLPQPPSNWRTHPLQPPPASNWRSHPAQPTQPLPPMQHHHPHHNQMPMVLTGGPPMVHSMVPIVLQRPQIYQQQPQHPPQPPMCFPGFIRMMPPPHMPPPTAVQHQHHMMPYPPMHQMTPQQQQQPPPPPSAQQQHHNQPPSSHQPKNIRAFYPQPASPMQAAQQGVPLQAPQGPQALRQNGVFPSSNGAFIPMQATRKQAAASAAAKHFDDKAPSGQSGAQKHRRGDTTANAPGAQPSQAAPAANAKQMSNISKAGVASGSDEPPKPSASSAGHRPRFVGPTPKPSRIAARFDMKP